MVWATAQKYSHSQPQTAPVGALLRSGPCECCGNDVRVGIPEERKLQGCAYSSFSRCHSTSSLPSLPHQKNTKTLPPQPEKPSTTKKKHQTRSSSHGLWAVVQPQGLRMASLIPSLIRPALLHQGKDLWRKRGEKSAGQFSDSYPKKGQAQSGGTFGLGPERVYGNSHIHAMVAKTISHSSLCSETHWFLIRSRRKYQSYGFNHGFILRCELISSIHSMRHLKDLFGVPHWAFGFLARATTRLISVGCQVS